MGAETASIAGDRGDRGVAVRPAGDRGVAARPAATLTWRAVLNAVQALLDYSAKLIVGLVVVPVLLSGLGRTLFGVWEMLGRLVGFMEATDGRPTQALRLVIAHHQATDDPAGKRRWVGSALCVWLLCLPLWAAAGTILIWLTPTITRLEPALQGTARLACALLIIGLLLAGLASLPESVLRGMNLGYKRMGFQAALSLMGGALMMGAIYGGLGLAGVAGAQIVVAAVTGICFWVLVRRYVPWFGMARPRAAEVTSLLGMSLWIAAGDILSKVLLASDVLVLGMVVSASTVTTYVLTGYAARLATNLHALSADAVMPGVAGVIGQKHYDRAAMLRHEMLALTWLFATATGATIALWNRSFLHLWVGGENYAGVWVNGLIVLMATQTALIRNDAYVLDAALRPGLRVLVSAVAAALTLGLTVVLTRSFGILGLCVGVLAGRSVQSVGFPMLVRSCLGRRPGFSVRRAARPLLVMAALFAGSAYLGRLTLARDWLTWLAGVAGSLALFLAIALRTGLPAESRRAVGRRLKDIGHGLRRERPIADAH